MFRLESLGVHQHLLYLILEGSLQILVTTNQLDKDLRLHWRRVTWVVSSKVVLRDNLRNNEATVRYYDSNLSNFFQN